MSNENFEDDFDDDFEIIIMTDDDGEDVEFAIIDNIMYKNERYLLVVESSELDDDEATALILKETEISENDVTYSLVEDDNEFDKISELFAENDENYDLEI